MALLVEVNGTQHSAPNVKAALRSFMASRTVEWHCIERLPLPASLCPWSRPELETQGDTEDEKTAVELEEVRRNPEQWVLKRLAVIDEEGLQKEAPNAIFPLIRGPILFYTAARCLYDGSELKIEEDEDALRGSIDLLHAYIECHRAAFA